MKKSGRTVILQEDNKSPAVLGLDISSSTIGWGLLTFDKELLAYGHIKPLDAKHSKIERLNDVYIRIKEICETFAPSAVAVEDIFIFMKNKSQAKTIVILTEFNRVVSLSAYRVVNNIQFYSVHDIRKSIQKDLKLASKIEKEDMPNIIRTHLAPNFSDILNRNNNQAKETGDEADGIAVAWCYILNRKE